MKRPRTYMWRDEHWDQNRPYDYCGTPQHPGRGPNDYYSTPQQQQGRGPNDYYGGAPQQQQGRGGRPQYNGSPSNGSDWSVSERAPYQGNAARGTASSPPQQSRGVGRGAGGPPLYSRSPGQGGDPRGKGQGPSRRPAPPPPEESGMDKLLASFGCSPEEAQRIRRSPGEGDFDRYSSPGPRTRGLQGLSPPGPSTPQQWSGGGTSGPWGRSSPGGAGLPPQSSKGSPGGMSESAWGGRGSSPPRDGQGRTSSPPRGRGLPGSATKNNIERKRAQALGGDTMIGTGFAAQMKRGVVQHDNGPVMMMLQNGFAGLAGIITGGGSKEEPEKNEEPPKPKGHEGPVPATEYEALPEDQIDSRVNWCLQQLPRESAAALKIWRKDAGEYEVDGREVKLDWQLNAAKSEVYVTDMLLATKEGAHTEPLGLYLRHAADVAYHLEHGGMAVTQVPRHLRLTFPEMKGGAATLGMEMAMNEDDRYNAMVLAREQAALRERAAEEFKATGNAPPPKEKKEKESPDRPSAADLRPPSPPRQEREADARPPQGGAPVVQHTAPIGAMHPQQQVAGKPGGFAYAPSHTVANGVAYAAAPGAGHIQVVKQQPATMQHAPSGYVNPLQNAGSGYMNPLQTVASGYVNPFQQSGSGYLNPLQTAGSGYMNPLQNASSGYINYRQMF